MRRCLLAWLALVVAPSVHALGLPSWVSTNAAPGAFPLAHDGFTAPLLVDSNDFWGVIRAAGDLESDLHRVTGFSPRTSADSAIIVGSLGHSALIDRLVQSGKIDVSAIAGKWESYVRVVVPHPTPELSSALVIAGSDKRGAIYGIYDLSEQIGVSPWHFFADVPDKHSAALFVNPAPSVSPPPAVKYRGIFLNDEAPDLTDWVKQNYGDYNHKFYTNIFELLLRLKANYLWPAMWNNCFNEDDAENPRLADAYGIVMGTSHVEPMMRADKEWNRLGYTAGQWNYDKSPNELKKFWRDGVERNHPYENIITIAMRGKIDTPMSEDANIALLEKIVAAQRDIITDVMHTNAASVPQLWALYKEVQEYYEKGMRVPDDVTLLWCDDNWGNIRRLPTPEERHRVGGAGVYYHFDYVGGPRNYKWLNTVQLPKIWEQMNLAYDYGADRIWIVNVGHLHHVMFPTEFFLTLAWNPSAWPKERISEFTRLWAAREFGPAHAPEIAQVVAQYTKWNARRKPELLDAHTFNLTNFQEFPTVVSNWTALAAEASRLNELLPSDTRDAYYELVLHPVLACANLNQMYLAAAEGNGPLTTNLFQKDAELSAYFNHTLAHGKWNHMMDQTHIGYTYWQQPPVNKIPSVAAPVESSAAPPPPLPAYVSIEAEHYTRKTDTPAAHWDVIPDYGRTLSSMAIFPTTTPSVLPPAAAPTLEYAVNLTNLATNAVTVQATVAPTLNFVPNRGLRYAVAFDDEPPQVIDVLARNKLADWEASVRDSARILTSTHHLSSGTHTLKISMVDPGLVLQKIVVAAGPLPPSYLGPPENLP
ncbi:MAG TPA: glycosyl hydrolase 115 family protein [Verrucomicrobiae bacterium]|jgi:hypothetical protein|nr:glycosyl hydrolase 115 family protein [Verrucomicrobiae bacterium]